MMKKLVNVIVLGTVFFASPTLEKTNDVVSKITYNQPGGRLGDQLITYCKAKWISYTQQIPLLYKPFEYSHELAMHLKEDHHDRLGAKKFKKIVKLASTADFGLIHRYNATLYVSNFIFFIAESSPEVLQQTTLRIERMINEFKNDQKFLDILREQIRPLAQLKKIIRPVDKTTVALHVRRGGGFDAPLASKSRAFQFADQGWPMKFPPDSFYIEQLQTISKMFNHKPLYVYLFTDDQNPAVIVKKYQDALKLANLEFDYRKEANSHDTNVLEDLFAMAEFDCIIRPHSNMSRISHIIGDHQVAIFPMNSRWEDDRLIIDQVKIMDDRAKFLKN